MRKIIPVLMAPLFAACALATAGAAPPAAGDASGSPTSRKADARQHAFDRIDTNHDGVASRAEYQAWVDARFDALDGNRDGRVDANEIVQSAATAERTQKHAERFVEHYDRSGAGIVDKADFEANAMSRFDRLAGGADTLTQEQLAAHHGSHRHHGGMSAQPDDANANGG